MRVLVYSQFISSKDKQQKPGLTLALSHGNDQAEKRSSRLKPLTKILTVARSSRQHLTTTSDSSEPQVPASLLALASSLPTWVAPAVLMDFNHEAILILQHTPYLALFRLNCLRCTVSALDP